MSSAADSLCPNAYAPQGLEPGLLGPAEEGDLGAPVGPAEDGANRNDHHLQKNMLAAQFVSGIMQLAKMLPNARSNHPWFLSKKTPSSEKNPSEMS